MIRDEFKEFRQYKVVYIPTEFGRAKEFIELVIQQQMEYASQINGTTCVIWRVRNEKTN